VSFSIDIIRMSSSFCVVCKVLHDLAGPISTEYYTQLQTSLRKRCAAAVVAGERYLVKDITGRSKIFSRKPTRPASGSQQITASV
jgi:hypothetical protein